MCRRVAPDCDYAADYLYQYWTVAETHKEMEIGSSTMYIVQCKCVDLINYIIIIIIIRALLDNYLIILSELY